MKCPSEGFFLWLKWSFVCNSCIQWFPFPSPVLSFCLQFQTGFYKGVAGSQVTLSSLVNQSRAMLEEQARHLLTEPERQTMSYYIQEYRNGHIGVEQLVMALFELLNTHAKVSLCEGFYWLSWFCNLVATSLNPLVILESVPPRNHHIQLIFQTLEIFFFFPIMIKLWFNFPYGISRQSLCWLTARNRY